MYTYRMASVKRSRKNPRKAKEKTAQNAFLEALELKGIRAWRVNSGTILSSYTPKKTGKPRFYAIKGAPKGTPDTCVHIHGPVFAWVEWKAPGETLNEDQLKWHAWAKEAGVLCAVHEDCLAALLEVSTWVEAYRHRSRAIG